jgi:hypothetical protein
MTKVLLCDLDGVVADSTKRFELAEEAKQQQLLVDCNPRIATDVYWRTALNGSHVHLDEMIENTLLHLHWLEVDGWQIAFLTSRPEHMRSATMDWLDTHDLRVQERRLEMKPESAKWTKTILWKIDRLQEIADELDADEVMLIDDESAIGEELTARSMTQVVKFYSSLAQACEKEQ